MLDFQNSHIIKKIYKKFEGVFTNCENLYDFKLIIYYLLFSKLYINYFCIHCAIYCHTHSISQPDFNYKAERILVIIVVSDNTLKYNKITQN